MLNWLRRLLRVETVVVHRTWRPMTAQELEQFDKAFKKMDEAFDEMNKVFRS